MPSALLWDGLVILRSLGKKADHLCAGYDTDAISGLPGGCRYHCDTTRQPELGAAMLTKTDPSMLRWTFGSDWTYWMRWTRAYCWAARLQRVMQSTTIWLLTWRLDCWFRSLMPAAPANAGVQRRSGGWVGFTALRIGLTSHLTWVMRHDDRYGWIHLYSVGHLLHIICQLLTKGIDKDKIYRNVFNNARVSAVPLWSSMNEAGSSSRSIPVTIQ